MSYKYKTIADIYLNPTYIKLKAAVDDALSEHEILHTSFALVMWESDQLADCEEYISHLEEVIKERVSNYADVKDIPGEVFYLEENNNG